MFQSTTKKYTPNGASLFHHWTLCAAGLDTPSLQIHNDIYTLQHFFKFNK